MGVFKSIMPFTSSAEDNIWNANEVSNDRLKERCNKIIPRSSLEEASRRKKIRCCLQKCTNFKENHDVP